METAYDSYDALLMATDEFTTWLAQSRRAPRTVRKYAADVRAFLRWREGQTDRPLPELLTAYRELLAARYRSTTCNSYLISLNIFLSHLGLEEYRLPLYRVQHPFARETVLTVQEYRNILNCLETAGDRKFYLILRTLAGTGLRVGELPFLSVRTVAQGWAEIRFKRKIRQVFLPLYLKAELLDFAASQGISGNAPIFQNKRQDGPVDSSCVWRHMKNAARQAGVDPAKAFPHNLRHLFAQTYLDAYGDIVDLADILGHSSIETTRIYTRRSSAEKIRRVSSLGL